ncbi:MAG: hypothetical protein HYX24_02350 [Candidatus Aenigmarchaeota archaeon]|nr:hypothetical protein [Candidatus Aenigmarchaeota archaeon]
MDLKKGVITGVVAGIVMIALGFVFMAATGTSDWYQKTFPMMVSQQAMPFFILSIFLAGLFMGLVYSVVNPSISGAGWKKGAYYGLFVWLLAGTMWPVMMIGFAGINIWLVELIAGLIEYAITGAVIAIVYSKLK